MYHWICGSSGFKDNNGQYNKDTDDNHRKNQDA
jgi:hypothetical protein